MVSRVVSNDPPETTVGLFVIAFLSGGVISCGGVVSKRRAVTSR